METSVVDVPDRGRFEVRLGDRVVGLASYHVENGTMTLPHTEVDPSVGGRGIGSTLVAGVLAAARERGRNETVCGLSLSRSRLARFPHVSWADVQPESGRHAEEVQAVCRRCHAALGGRRDDRGWTRTNPRP